AKEGAKFTDWCGQQSCTAGRAAFIMGQSPIRTGMTKVGLPGASLVRRVFMLVPAQTYVAKWISSFKEFRRGRSRPASAWMRGGRSWKKANAADENERKDKPPAKAGTSTNK